MKELTNLIIGPFDNEGQFNGVKAFLEKNGIEFQASKFNKDAKYSEACLINLFKNGSIKKFSIFTKERYIHYQTYDNAPISGKEVYTYWQFNDAFMLKKEVPIITSNDIVKNPRALESINIEDERNPFGMNEICNRAETPQVQINKKEVELQNSIKESIVESKLSEDRIKLLYSKLSNVDTVDRRIKFCLEELFGVEMFKKPEYKVGNVFEHGSKRYTIAKVGSNGVFLMDENFENFSLVKPVKDVYKITEAEFMGLAGHYFDKLKLVK